MTRLDLQSEPGGDVEATFNARSYDIKQAMIVSAAGSGSGPEKEAALGIRAKCESLH